LTNLSLQVNSLQELDGNSFNSLKNLEHLSIGNNKLEHLPTNLFKELAQLKQLHLPELTSLKEQELDANLFVGLKKLEILQLDQNRFDNFPENFFDDLTSLQFLNLMGNPIKSLNKNWFNKLIDLKVLRFEFALFEIVPDGLFKNNGNLTHLKLSGKIAKMSNKMFSDLKHLKKIDLLDNQCISMEIEDHNSSIAFTEQMLIPCSCKALEVENSDFHTKAAFIFVGVIVAIISLILILILIKTGRQKNFQPREIYQTLKNGEFFSPTIQSKTKGALCS
jgi:Leucine-rich repeat (LRR) protein